MPSALDIRYDEVMARVLGSGGRLEAAPDSEGRLYVTTLPGTLPGFFDAFCALMCEVVAVVAGNERLTFAALNVAANDAARALIANHGVKKGDRVGIAMRNAPAWIVVYMAVVKAGGIATLLNGWWKAGELAHALRLTEPVLVLADAPRAANIAQAELGMRVLVLPIERPLADALAPLGAAGDAALPQVAPEDDATILFTSGSTGDSKGAVSTHRAVTSGCYTYAAGLVALLEIKTEEGRPPVDPPRTLLSVPLFHVTGAVPVMLNSFVIGRGMVLMPKWDAGEALRLIEAEKITYFVGVPTMSLELMTHPDRDLYNLSSMTDVTAGGAPRPVAHVERLKASFPAAQPALGYGLTETNAVGCANFWSNYAEKPASTGRAQNALVEVAIVGEDGARLASGQRGEVGIRSAANFRGYWRDAAATRAAFTAEGYFLTGDVGYLDADGYLFIVDRKKDIIIRGGENISCQEVEAAIYSHPAVAEASVFGLLDERLGEVPGAVVHLEAGEMLDEDALRAFLAEQLAAFKQPASIWFHADPLPKLGTGKIDKVGLRDRYRIAA